MKFSKTNEKQIREFMAIMDSDGCVTVEKWTSGKGGYTTNKALPPFVTRHERKEHGATNRPQKGTTERTAWEFFNRQENARRKVVLVFDLTAWNAFVFDAIHGKEF